MIMGIYTCQTDKEKLINKEDRQIPTRQQSLFKKSRTFSPEQVTCLVWCNYTEYAHTCKHARYLKLYFGTRTLPRM